MYKTENARHCIYFILLSFIVLLFEFGMLLYSDYSAFYNAISAPIIVIFETNIYLLCMFYFLLPLGSNEYAELGNINDDEKSLFTTDEPDVVMANDLIGATGSPLPVTPNDTVVVDTTVQPGDDDQNDPNDPTIVNLSLQDTNDNNDNNEIGDPLVEKKE